MTASNGRTEDPMEKQAYLSALHGDAAALATAARLGLDAPVPSCPGWIVANIAIHLGTVYRGWVEVIQAHGSQWPLDIRRRVLEQTFPQLIELFEQGEQGVAPRAIPDGLVEWFEDGAAELDDAFRQADLDEPCWMPPDWPSPGGRTARDFLRAANIETAVHRWDAQLAHHSAAPIGRAVAEMGIEQALTQMPVLNRWYVKDVRQAPAPPGTGETYSFQQTDGKGAWRVRFEGDEVILEAETGPADVTVRGTASDLLLFLWHRIPADRLAVDGRVVMLDRYFELVPPL